MATASAIVRTIRRSGACGRITRSGWPSLPNRLTGKTLSCSLGSRRLAGTAGQLLPPVRQGRRHALRERERRKLEERALIDAALEVDHLAHWLPEACPSPLVEFRLVRAPEVKLHRLVPQAQQKPALLLPDAERLLVAPHVARR